MSEGSVVDGGARPEGSRLLLWSVIDSVSDGLLGSTCETVERVFADCQPGPHAPGLLSNMLGASAESLAGLYALAKGGADAALGLYQNVMS